MSHECHAEGCSRKVPPKMFACRSHWFALPKKIQDAIWREYRPGQERSKDPTVTYLAVQQYAVAWLARRDGLVEASNAAVFAAVEFEARSRGAGLGEPLRGLERFWEDRGG